MVPRHSQGVPQCASATVVTIPRSCRSVPKSRCVRDRRKNEFFDHRAAQPDRFLHDHPGSAVQLGADDQRRSAGTNTIVNNASGDIDTYGGKGGVVDQRPFRSSRLTDGRTTRWTSSTSAASGFRSTPTVLRVIRAAGALSEHSSWGESRPHRSTTIPCRIYCVDFGPYNVSLSVVGYGRTTTSRSVVRTPQR